MPAKIRLPTHTLAALFLLIVLWALLISNLGPQIPVDLRPSFNKSEAIQGNLPMSRASKYDLLALRYVLDDIRFRVGLLQEEAEENLDDADLLWNQWQSDFGVRGGLIEFGRFLREPETREQRVLAERMQADIFRVESRERQIKSDADDLAKSVLEAEKAWRRISGKISEGALAGLRSTLSQLMDRMNILDADIENRQADLDDVYTRFQFYAEDRRPGSWYLPPPEHWDRMLGDQSRSALRYDFDRNYGEALKRVHRELSSPSR